MDEQLTLEEFAEDLTPPENLDRLLSSIPGMDTSGIEELAVLLSMPDDQFDSIAPFVNDELYKTLNNPSQRAALLQSYKEAGYSLEEVNASFGAWLDNIDAALKDELSESKLDFLKATFASIITALNIGDSEKNSSVINIAIQLDEDSKCPVYANLTDAGADIFAAEDITLAPGEQRIVKTGVRVAIPEGYAILVQPRSGLSAKTHLRIANTPGLIDAGYRGEIGIIMENNDSFIRGGSPQFNEQGIMVGIDMPEFGQSYGFSKGDKIAQLRLVAVPHMNFYKVKDVNTFASSRGEGGFGSTGQ